MKRTQMLSMILLNGFFLAFAHEPAQPCEQASNDHENIICCADQHDCPYDLKTKEEDERIEHLAIVTVANMAQGIVNIGNNPDDPKAVAKEVAGIVANFTNFVLQAMKNPAALKLLEDEQFIKNIAVCLRRIQINDQAQ